MGGGKGGKNGRTVCTLVLDQGEARVRKAFAPAARPLADRRRKEPRHRPDHLAETAERRQD